MTPILPFIHFKSNVKVKIFTILFPTLKYIGSYFLILAQQRIIQGISNNNVKIWHEIDDVQSINNSLAKGYIIYIILHFKNSTLRDAE